MALNVIPVEMNAAEYGTFVVPGNCVVFGECLI